MGKKVKKQVAKPTPKTVKLSKKIMKENHRQILQQKLPPDIHDVKNKHRRIHLADVKRLQQNKAKKLERLRKQKLREELGEEAAPKGETRSIEKLREDKQELITEVIPQIQEEENIDEFSPYFRGETKPRVLLTTSRRPNGKVFDFLKNVKKMIPGLQYYERKNYKLTDIQKWAVKRGFTDVLVIGEKNGVAHTAILTHLPQGPTATFRITSIRLHHQIQGAGNPTHHAPELIINNFDTKLGHRVARQLACLFPQKPDFYGRQVVTFHNLRDFIFVRFHRYIYDVELQKAVLQELGPRFTLRLRSLQLGLFGDKRGEYEFLFRAEMQVSRKKFFL